MAARSLQTELVQQTCVSALHVNAQCAGQLALLVCIPLQLQHCMTAAPGVQAEQHMYRSAAGLTQHGNITAAGWHPSGGVAAG